MSDEKLDGRLADRIIELRTAGLSWRQMSQVLYAEHGLTASSETLRLWANRIEFPAEAKAS